MICVDEMEKLKIWQEITGTLKSIKRVNEEIILGFTKDIKIILPSADCINEILSDYIGDKIGILRTDKNDEPYRIKLIERNEVKENDKNKDKKNKRKVGKK